MSSTSKAASGTTAQASPASYELDVCTLYTNAWKNQDGVKEIDIKSMVSGISITESIYRSSIQVKISIIDATNLFEIIKLAGNEKISLELSNTELKDGDAGEKKKFELEIFIAEIGEYSKPKPGTQTYTFTCVAEHAYINNLKILSKKFEGSISQIVETITKKDLDVKKCDINTSSKGKIKGIFPSIRPLHAVSWLLRNASDDSTPYFYWQSATGKVYFKSYKDLIEQDVYRTYQQKAFNSFTVGTEEYYKEEQTKIRDITSELGMGKFIASRQGSYASTMHSLDISTKKYSISRFNKPAELKKMNEFPNYSEETEYQSKKIPEFSESRNYYIVENSASHDSFGNYHEPIVPTLLKSEAYMNNLDFMTQDMTLNGDFELETGSLIGLEIPKSSSPDELEEEAKDMIDQHQSGLYIITEITHNFAPGEYTMEVRCKKDSLTKSLDEV